MQVFEVLVFDIRVQFGYVLHIVIINVACWTVHKYGAMSDQYIDTQMYES